MKLTTIPLGSITASGNIRQGKPTKGALATLAASIDAVGLIQPLIVREPSGPDAGGKGVKSYALVAGYRRLEALKKLKKPKTYQVPVVVLDVEETDLDAARRLAENHVREPLTLLEETDAFAGLVAQGKSQAEIAAMFAVSERYVGQRLQLARLCPEAREHVIAGKLPLSAAGRLAAQAPERQLAVLAELSPPDVGPLDGEGRGDAPPDACLGKTVYASKAEAIRQLRYRFRSSSGCNIYRCEHCRGWHVGGQMTSKAKTTRKPSRPTSKMKRPR